MHLALYMGVPICINIVLMLLRVTIQLEGLAHNMAVIVLECCIAAIHGNIVRNQLAVIISMIDQGMKRLHLIGV